MSAIEELEEIIREKTSSQDSFSIALTVAYKLKEIIEYGESDVFGLKGYFVNAEIMHFYWAKLLTKIGLARNAEEHMGGGFYLLKNDEIRMQERLLKEGFYSEYINKV